MNAIAVMPINDVERIAQAVAKSNLFGVKDSTQALCDSYCVKLIHDSLSFRF